MVPGLNLLTFVPFAVRYTAGYSERKGIGAAPQEQPFVPASVKVFINDEQILFEQEPVIYNGAMLLPLRKIAESLGATVKWEPLLNQTVHIEKDKKKLILSLKSNRVLYQRKLFVMEQAQ
ncbi:MAG TPA: hypothetical protein DEF36_09000 [Desulfotomaculum sp.]|nr:hypothetical protein [Desulfotomaculum sp.]